MSNRTVTVLAPNGRRQTVKCSLNTTLLQILEEVCAKQGFNAIEYDIKHHNKALDTSLTVQFSGLPNNAQLELAPTNRIRKETEVTVALNLENGDRKMGTFQPSNTLREILASLYENKEPNPVVIYMRREIYGDDLSRTDLRSLGLTGGRAMFRVIHKAPEELKNQPNVSSVIPAKPKEEKPYKRIFKPIEQHSNEDKLYSRENEKRSNNESENVSVGHNITKQDEGSEQNEVMSTEEDKSSSDILPEKQNGYLSQGNISHSDDNSPEKAYLDSMKLEDFPFFGNRKGLIFPLESNQPLRQEDPPDEFFNLTVDDAKIILRDIKKRREDAEEGGPLMTSQLRELEESKKQLRQLNMYTKCIIRVLFPDRTVLQGVFSPTDSVNAVIEFVAENLATNNIAFYLYTTPPKLILPVEKRLIEVNCVPGALLHFGTGETLMNTNNIFREDLKDKFTTNSIASLAALKIREEAKRKSKEHINDQTTAIPGCSKDPDFPNTQQRNMNTTSKVPKWFKGT